MARCLLIAILAMRADRSSLLMSGWCASKALMRDVESVSEVKQNLCRNVSSSSLPLLISKSYLIRPFKQVEKVVSCLILQIVKAAKPKSSSSPYLGKPRFSSVMKYLVSLSSKAAIAAS